MSTVFETRLIGNIGKDASIRTLENGGVAINFPVAHNRNWKDRKTGESKTNTTWVNCTIWKRDGGNLKIADLLRKGALVEIIGTPVAKAYPGEDGHIRTEIRLNVDSVNILRSIRTDESDDFFDDEDNLNSDFTLDSDDF